MLWQRLGDSINKTITFSESPIHIHSRRKKHGNPQHKVKQFSVIKITSIRDMEISHVPVSKSLGNCEHLYNQMSSESLGESEKVRTRLLQSMSTSHTGGSAHFSWQHFIKDRGLCTGITLCTKPSYFYTNRHTGEAKAMFNL